MVTARKQKPSNGDEFQAKLDALKSDLEVLQRDLKGLAGGAGAAAAERLNNALNDALGTVQDLGDRVEDWSSDHLASLRKSVREQPLAACMLAMGVGAVLWSVLFRR